MLLKRGGAEAGRKLLIPQGPKPPPPFCSSYLCTPPIHPFSYLATINALQTTPLSFLSILIIFAPFVRLDRSLFSDRDLDPLRRKALAELRALHHAGEFLCREDREGLAETGGEHGGAAGVDALRDGSRRCGRGACL